MKMLQYLNQLEEGRRWLLAETEALTAHQYNLIPEGSNNNIVWNMGHLLVTAETLLYGNAPTLRWADARIEAGYRKGSKPDGIVSEDDIRQIRNGLLESISASKLAASIEQSGIAEDWIRFLLFHEAMHYETIAWLIVQVKEEK